MSTPYEIDDLVSSVAETKGMELARYGVIDITEGLPSNYMHLTPNYALIRKHLKDGVDVPGAKLTNRIEYILVEREEPKA